MARACGRSSLAGMAAVYWVGRGVAHRVDDPSRQRVLGFSIDRIHRAQEQMRARGSWLLVVNRFVPAFHPFGYDINANAGTATIVLYMSLIASALFFCLGIIGEYLAVIIKEVKKRPVAVVAENILAVVAGQDDIVAGSRKLQSRRSAHKKTS